MKIRALKNNIIFQFVQDVTDGGFMNKTDWNFLIRNKDADPRAARWGKVTNVGPEVKDAVVGDYVLIEPLMWTLGMDLTTDMKVWATNETKLMATSKIVPKDIV